MKNATATRPSGARVTNRPSPSRDSPPHDPRGGTVADLAAAQPDAVGATVSVSPDARYALFARVDELTVDLMGVPLRRARLPRNARLGTITA